jgi:AcrR family transcriptional regulator
MATSTTTGSSASGPASGPATGLATVAAKYHHGDLRRTLIDAAVARVTAQGAATLSLRGLAADAGVSHAAPVHHFGDKAGLFTAVAIEGYDELADELIATWESTRDFLEVGVRYVHFALTHPGHFEVMFRSDYLNGSEPELVRAKERAFSMLHDPLVALGRGGDPARLQAATLASWSIVHGLATLVLSGNLPELDRTDPDPLARQVIAHCGWPDSPRSAHLPGSGSTAR